MGNCEVIEMRMLKTLILLLVVMVTCAQAQPQHQQAATHHHTAATHRQSITEGPDYDYQQGFLPQGSRRRPQRVRGRRPIKKRPQREGGHAVVAVNHNGVRNRGEPGVTGFLNSLRRLISRTF